MKTHSEQFRECKKEELTGHTRKFLFKTYSSLLPANPRIRKKLLAVTDGIQFVSCLRFGGVCSNQKKQCKELRK